MFIKAKLEGEELSFGEISRMFARKDLSAILRQHEAIARALEGLRENCRRLRWLKEKSAEKEQLLEAVTERQERLARIFSDFSQGVGSVRRLAEQLGVAFPNADLPTPAVVLSYAAKIASYTQTPKFENRSDIQLTLPLSFRYNFADADEFDCSWLSYQYRENKTYRACPVPKIKFTNNTQQNIKEQRGNRYIVHNAVYLTPVVSANFFLQFSNRKYPPKVIYTTDGTEPTRFNCAPESAEDNRLGIYVSRSTRFKFRTIQPGFIDSEVNELFIDILEGEPTNQFAENMERPIHGYDVDFDEFGDDAGDDLFVGENFASFNDYRNLSTPR